VTIVLFGAYRSRRTNLRHPRPAALGAPILLLFQAAFFTRLFLRLLRYLSRGFFCFLEDNCCRLRQAEIDQSHVSNVWGSGKPGAKVWKFAHLCPVPSIVCFTIMVRGERDRIGAMVVIPSAPNGVNLTLFFISPLSLSLTGRRCLQCASDARVDSDRPPTISGSL
jgi:hypothetical protein